MNRLLLPALLVTLGLPFSASADTITLQLPVGPVYRIVDTIAEKTGMTLKVDAEISRDILYIDVKDVETEDLLSKIANATAGKWRKLPDGSMVLSNDPATLNRRETAARQKRAEFLGKSLQSHVEQTLKAWYAQPDPKKRPANQNEGDEDFELNEYRGSPGRFLLAKCAQQLSPGILAAMQTGDRIVYSTTPTRMQQRLSLTNQTVHEFLTEYNKMATMQESDENQFGMAREAGPDDPDSPDSTTQEEVEAMMSAFGQWNIKRSVQKDVPSKVLLIASRPTMSMFSFLGGGGNGVMLDLLVLDQKGNVIENENLPLGEQNFLTEMMEDMTKAAAEAMPATEELAEGEVATEGTAVQDEGASGEPVTGEEELAQPPEYKAKFPIKSGDIEQSKETKMLLAIGSGGGMVDVTQLTVPPELKPLLLDPETYDPLGFTVQDACRSLAKHSGWNVVVNLSDQTIGSSMFSFMETRKETTQQFYDSLLTTHSYSADQTGNWLTLYPQSLVQARSTRVHRGALKKFLGQISVGTTPSLDELAEYAATSPDFRVTPFVSPYLMAANPSMLGQSMMGGQNWDVLRALGSLSRGQRDSARRGTPISMRSLTTAQSNAFRTLIFGADYRTKPIKDLKAADPVTSMLGMFSMGMMRATPKDYVGEPTEALPWGIPADATITLQFEADDVFKITGDVPMFNFFPNMGTNELALMNMFFQVAPPDSMGGQDFSKMMDNLIVGDREVITLRVNLGDLVGIEEKLTDDRLDAKKPKVAFANLSKEQAAKLSAATEKLKQHPIVKMMMRSMKSSGGQVEGSPAPRKDP